MKDQSFDRRKICKKILRIALSLILRRRSTFLTMLGRLHQLYLSMQYGLSSRIDDKRCEKCLRLASTVLTATLLFLRLGPAIAYLGYMDLRHHKFGDD